MANKIVKSDYLALKKFNQKTEKGDIFERDIMTINPLEDLFTPGQDVVYSDSNFKFSVRTDQDRTKKHTKDGWLKTPEGEEVWHLSDVDSSPISEESEVVIKPDYSSIKDFAYYGSAVEMLRAAVNHVIMYFPAELYFSKQTLNDYIGLVGDDKIPDYGIYKVIPNDFNINIEVDTIEEENLDNPYRYLCLHAINYDLYKEGELQSSGITRNDFQKNPDYSCGDGVLGTVTLISSGLSFTITVYVYNNENYLIYNDDSYTEYSIRPNSVLVNEYFATIDEFEKVLLNRETKPLYKSVFETPYETDEGNKYVMESYIWPSRNDWNPIIDGGGYEMYIGSLIKLASFHDEYDSNIIWRMLTHEAIKNLDWTFFRENGDNVEDLSKIDSSKIEAFLQLYGRQFDGLKRYIDSIKYTNNVTYDEKNNLPDYMLTDVVENSGFEAILPNATAKTDVISEPLYPSKSIGSSEVDANTQFMRNLKINAPYINSLKGTRYGVETMLKLLGLKDGEFKITEYVTVATGSSEQCTFSDDLSYGDNFYPRATGVKYPSIKDVISINLNKGDGTLDDMETYFDGIPVKPFRKMTGEGKDETYYAIPWYENGKQYDGGWYFQSKGGWAKRKCEKIDNSVVDSGVTELCYDEIDDSIIYDESESSLKYAETVSEMKGFFKSEIKDGMICYVTNLETWDEYSADVTSHYFIYNENGDTWDNISVDKIRNAEIPNGAKVVYLENIKESTEGNNPHISNDEYDDGQEYLEYMNQIFKHTLDTSGFTRFSKNDIDKIKDFYKFNIGDLIEDNNKCDYFFNPNSASTLSAFTSAITIDGQTYASNPEGGEINAEPAANSIINVKNLRLEIKKEIVSGNTEINEKWQDYITNVVMNYVKQMLPSTTIFSWEFTGGTPTNYLKWSDGTTGAKTVNVNYNATETSVGIKTNVSELDTSKTGIVTGVSTATTAINVNFNANTRESQVEGTATVSYGGSALTVTVIQSGKPYFKWNDGSTAVTTENVYYNGATITSGYTTTYSNLSFTSNQSWCTITTASTSSVTATITANDSSINTREAIITVSNGLTVVGTWKIKQEKKPESKYFSWNESSIVTATTDTIGYDGSDDTWYFYTNYNVSDLSFTSTQTSWIRVDSVSSSNNELTLEWDENTGDTTREAVIEVRNGSTLVGKLTITQEKLVKYLWIIATGQTTASTLNVTSAATSLTYNILTNYSQAELDAFTSTNPDWINTVKLTKSTRKLTFNVAENPISTSPSSRSGDVMIGGLTVSVSQIAGEMFKINLKINGSTSPSNISSTTTGFTITTEPNDSLLSYRVYTINHLITTNKTGNFTYTYNWGSNTATTERSITITAKSMDDAVSETVTIKQNGAVPQRIVQIYGGGRKWSVNMFDSNPERVITFEMRGNGEGTINGYVQGTDRGTYEFDMDGMIEFTTTNMNVFTANIELIIDSDGESARIDPISVTYGFEGGTIGGSTSGYPTYGSISIPAGSAGNTTRVQIDSITWETSD